MLERGPRLTSREDEDVSAAIRGILEAEGIEIHVGADDIRFTKSQNGFEVTPRSGSAPIVGSHALIAVGRVACKAL